ncbi:hypothetical protein K0M31_014832 [Melipona bicolor]|uniref:C2H2-type domain-containing protein n=1 Tax=Melipona bicolor TaxID=60889 RepID=A0AA40KFK3_9HYME|nr:hypothetical protein K0M31_014832 [Melipona bicolor]
MQQQLCKKQVKHMTARTTLLMGTPDSSTPLDCNVEKDSKAEEDGSAYKRTENEKNEQAFEGEQQDWNRVRKNSEIVGSEDAAEKNDEDAATGKDSGGVDGSGNVQSYDDRVVSVTDIRYLCDVCSKTFASKSGLRFHMKSHTSAAKAHPCRHCGKGFAIPSYARRHERIHAGDKRFVCHFCSAAFASSNGLKYHLRLHSGEANYHCETCGKSFYRRKYLNEHVFTHTGERPYVCKACGASYASSGSLFVHQKRCKNK